MAALGAQRFIWPFLLREGGLQIVMSETCLSSAAASLHWDRQRNQRRLELQAKENHRMRMTIATWFRKVGDRSKYGCLTYV